MDKAEYLFELIKEAQTQGSGSSKPVGPSRAVNIKEYQNASDSARVALGNIKETRVTADASKNEDGTWKGRGTVIKPEKGGRFTLHEGKATASDSTSAARSAGRDAVTKYKAGKEGRKSDIGSTADPAGQRAHPLLTGNRESFPTESDIKKVRRATAGAQRAVDPKHSSRVDD